MAGQTQPQSPSLWTARSAPQFGALRGDISVDVAVIGGGIVGMTTASLLQAMGRRVAVVESRSVGRQTTGGSSAKITAQHSLIYRRLTHTFGKETARAYAEANANALDWLSARITGLGIDCGFAQRSAYTYTNDQSRLDEVRDEAETARDLGLPARFTNTIPLPVPALGAVAFDGQAQFDPYAYLLAEAERFVAAGGTICEETRVTDVDVESAPHSVRTERGTVSARDVVITTNLPILDRGLYYARAFPIAHLAIAALVDGDMPDGMFLSVDRPTHSLRWHRDREGRLWLIALGPRFRTGTGDTEDGFRILEAFARGYFPVRSIGHRWWNEDFESADGIPYVGRLSSKDEHLYVATGFGGWGITNGIAAAHLLADAIEGRENRWAAAFDSTRTIPARAAGDAVSGNLPTAKAWLAGRIGSPPALDLEALGPRDGMVVEVDGKPVAVSRDAGGTLHAVGAECTHLGCIIAWNRAMQTWDCPCHGSSFDQDGHVLRGPAIPDLERKSIEAATRRR